MRFIISSDHLEEVLVLTTFPRLRTHRWLSGVNMSEKYQNHGQLEVNLYDTWHFKKITLSLIKPQSNFLFFLDFFCSKIIDLPISDIINITYLQVSVKYLSTRLKETLKSYLAHHIAIMVTCQGSEEVLFIYIDIWLKFSKYILEMWSLCFCLKKFKI